jgi:hypothetical protein
MSNKTHASVVMSALRPMERGYVDETTMSA